MLFEVGKIAKYCDQLEIIYITNGGVVSQRRIKVLKVDKDVLQAYCYLRKENRTFKIENILAFVPIQIKKGVAV